MRKLAWTGWNGWSAIGCALAVVGGLASWTAAPPKSEAQASQPALDRPVSFNRDVRPILSENCFQCHGHDAGSREADLRLDTQEGLFADLDGIPLIAPGDPADSELYLRIASDDPEDRMPHADSGLFLSDEQIGTIERWIAEGAVWEGHWAYQALERPPVPKPADSTWARNPVDNFLLAGIEARGWQPSPDADPRTLLRRLSQDLTGLPPTPDELAEYLAAPPEQAIAAAIDRLLASPHYAERMSVHWLDLVRYADTVGYHGDQDRSMSPYRDYVLRAFDQNKPFDEFVIEQLAGDLLPNPTREQQVASGYNRLNQITAEGGAQDKEYMAIYAADRVRTTSTVFLGSTLACAQCHDHKFDPFTARDFYSFAAFFADIEERGVFNGANNDGNWGPRVAVPSVAEQSAILAHESELAELDQRLSTMTPELAGALSLWEEGLRAHLPAEAQEFDWVDDTLVAAGTTSGGWNFVEAGEVVPLSGQKVRKQSGAGIVQHFFQNAERTLRIGEGDRFYAHVWLASDDAPSTLMLQINVNGSWEHRAFWGEDRINFGGLGTDSPGHRRMGALPATGEWVRLEVDASAIGLTPGMLVNGMAFTQFDGLAYWDRSGLLAQNPLHSFEGVEVSLQEVLAISPSERTTEQQAAVHSSFLALSPALDSVRAKRTAVEQELATVRAGVALSLVSKATTPRVMRILPRGNWMDDSGPEVFPAVPAFLPQPASSDADRLTRLDLAHWFVDPENPLTARVFVNRIWSLFFGRGLSKSVGDFGAQGGWPDQPELLDWLAMEFIESGWDVKQLVRTIVSSRAYRQASSSTGPQARDPQNAAFARQERFRLDAEFVRDHALAVSGLLSTEVGGKSVKPYQPPGFWRELNFPMREWQHDADQQGLRRGLYTYWCRTFLHPSLAAFDAATREECTVERVRSNTPQQALVLLNDTTYVEAARGLALRMLTEVGDSTERRLQHGFQLALQRDPSAEESAVLLDLLDRAPGAEAVGLLELGDHARADGLDQTEMARWTTVARVLLNLHEFITRY
jgi:mono/diheme cytochrome c family protein